MPLFVLVGKPKHTGDLKKQLAPLVAGQLGGKAVFEEHEKCMDAVSSISRHGKSVKAVVVHSGEFAKAVPYSETLFKMIPARVGCPVFGFGDEGKCDKFGKKYHYFVDTDKHHNFRDPNEVLSQFQAACDGSFVFPDPKGKKPTRKSIDGGTAPSPRASIDGKAALKAPPSRRSSLDGKPARQGSASGMTVPRQGSVGSMSGMTLPQQGSVGSMTGMSGRSSMGGMGSVGAMGGMGGNASMAGMMGGMAKPMGGNASMAGMPNPMMSRGMGGTASMTGSVGGSMGGGMTGGMGGNASMVGGGMTGGMGGNASMVGGGMTNSMAGTASMVGGGMTNGMAGTPSMVGGMAGMTNGMANGGITNGGMTNGSGMTNGGGAPNPAGSLAHSLSGTPMTNTPPLSPRGASPSPAFDASASADVAADVEKLLSQGAGTAAVVEVLTREVQRLTKLVQEKRGGAAAGVPQMQPVGGIAAAPSPTMMGGMGMPQMMGGM